MLREKLHQSTWVRAQHLLDLFSILQHHKRRHGTDTERACHFWYLVHIYFDDFEALVQLVIGRSNSTVSSIKSRLRKL